MIPARHPSTTRELGAPLNWNEAQSGPCFKLPLADIEEGGLPFMESLWSLESIERAALIAGEKVILRVQGTSHPVVSLGVTAPSKPPGGKAVDNHNQLAPELTLKLLMETSTEAEAMIALESVILGVMLRYRPQVREASEFLDTITERVIGRLG